MARKRSNPPEPTPSLEEALRCLLLPCATRHQHLCGCLGQLALDLPLEEGSATRLRQANRLVVAALEDWLVEVLQSNVLAGAVLTEALHWSCELLRHLYPTLNVGFADPITRRRLTEATAPYDVEFVVPAGWEFVLRDTSHGAGFGGIALVRRCHLSRSWGQGAAGHGRLVGQQGKGLEQAAGFNLVCGYLPGMQVEGEQLSRPQGPDEEGVPVRLPYAFVRRAFGQPQAEGEPLTFIPRPSDEEVYELAVAARDRLARRRRPRGGPISWW
jgi:hypothetical protein